MVKLPMKPLTDSTSAWVNSVAGVVDILGSGLALIVFSPIMMLVAILVKLDSPGAVFYAQERMGLDARPFMMLKFRSMRPDAEAQTGPVWATEDDPRRTRIGTFMRRFSIWEG